MDHLLWTNMGIGGATDKHYVRMSWEQRDLARGSFVVFSLK